MTPRLSAGLGAVRLPALMANSDVSNPLPPISEITHVEVASRHPASGKHPCNCQCRRSVVANAPLAHLGVLPRCPHMGRACCRDVTARSCRIRLLLSKPFHEAARTALAEAHRNRIRPPCRVTSDQAAARRLTGPTGTTMIPPIFGVAPRAARAGPRQQPSQGCDQRAPARANRATAIGGHDGDIGQVQLFERPGARFLPPDGGGARPCIDPAGKLADRTAA